MNLHARRRLGGMSHLTIRGAEPVDADAIAAIYNQGIEDRLATLATETRSAEERRRWLSPPGPLHPALARPWVVRTSPRSSSTTPPRHARAGPPHIGAGSTRFGEAGGRAGTALPRWSRASGGGSARSSERYVTSSGRATMMPLCVRTLAT